jgi:hypothetical protein
MMESNALALVASNIGYDGVQNRQSVGLQMHKAEALDSKAQKPSFFEKTWFLN